LSPSHAPEVPPRRILLVKFWGLGSLVCAAPLAAALRSRHPSAGLDLLTFDWQSEAAALLGIADRIFTLEARSLAGFLGSAVRTLAAIRRRRYSAVIDLEFFSKFTAIASFLSGAPMRIGFEFRPIYRGDLFTHPIPFNDRLHVIRNFRSLGEPLGIEDAPAAYPRIEPPPEAVAAAAARLAPVADRERYVVLNPNVSEHSAHLRRWAPERFAELARRLAGEDGCGVVLIGGPAERDRTAALARRIGPIPGVLDLGGRLTIAELAAVLAGAAVVVTSDTGPMHLAVAVGTPTVAFFGTETPTLYGPIGEGHAVIHRDLRCSPCLTVYNEKVSVCRYDNVCMRSIGTPEVLEAVRARLGASPGPRAAGEPFGALVPRPS
jgi:ADP-heptose:LPS heptosyltransferase